jgi:hypothetical protein
MPPMRKSSINLMRFLLSSPRLLGQEYHRLGEVGLGPGGGRPAGWSGLHGLSPPTQASSPCVDAWQPRLGPKCLKPWLTGQGVGLTGWPLGPLSLGSGPLGPCVKYTSVVMMILTFGQLHFVIH